MCKSKFEEALRRRMADGARLIQFEELVCAVKLFEGWYSYGGVVLREAFVPRGISADSDREPRQLHPDRVSELTGSRFPVSPSAMGRSWIQAGSG